MLKKLKTLLAVAVLSGTVGSNVQAAELTVQKGDNLWDLSKIHHTSVENIQKWNHLSTDLIHPGDVLKVATEKQYTVQQDDTLWDVAVNYQVSVNQIKEWNKLTTDLIHPGLNLIIYDALPEKVKNVDSATESPENDKLTNNDTAPIEPVTQPQVTKSETVNETSQANEAPDTPEITEKSNEDNTKEITVKATAYTASCEGCSGTTATGVDLNANPDAKVIAVDPSVIPLGSKVYVEGYGEATAADTGGAIKGNRIDVFIPTEQDALNWGNKQVNVTIINN